MRLLIKGDAERLFPPPALVLPFSSALASMDEKHNFSLYYSLSGIPPAFGWDRPRSVDLTAPLTLQLRESENERPWRITLGAAQAAGTAYILYRHLKKYGFR